MTLLEDSLDACRTDVYHAEAAQAGIITYHGEVNESTHIWSPPDRGLGSAMKEGVRVEQESHLDEDPDLAELWESGKMPMRLKRILLTHWVSKAWAKMTSKERQMLAYADHSGCNASVSGINDQRIEVDSLPSWKPPSPQEQLGEEVIQQVKNQCRQTGELAEELKPPIEESSGDEDSSDSDDSSTSSSSSSSSSPAPKRPRVEEPEKPGESLSPPAESCLVGPASSIAEEESKIQPKDFLDGLPSAEQGVLTEAMVVDILDRKANRKQAFAWLMSRAGERVKTKGRYHNLLIDKSALLAAAARYDLKVDLGVVHELQLSQAGKGSGRGRGRGRRSGK